MTATRFATSLATISQRSCLISALMQATGFDAFTTLCRYAPSPLMASLPLTPCSMEGVKGTQAVLAHILRWGSRFHRGVIHGGIDPRSGVPLCIPPAHGIARLPFAPHTPLVEIGYSDDRRPLARSDSALERMLDTTCHGCWAAAGAVNGDKLKVYKVREGVGRLEYVSGSIHPVTGPLTYTKGGLSLAGVPLVVGDRPPAAYAKALRKVQLVRHVLLRLRISLILLLRIIISYIVGGLDYVDDALPIHPSSCAALQRAVDGVVTLGLRVPRSAPKVFLYGPLRAGGFGVPVLRLRHSLRHVRGCPGKTSPSTSPSPSPSPSPYPYLHPYP